MVEFGHVQETRLGLAVGCSFFFNFFFNFFFPSVPVEFPDEKFTDDLGASFASGSMDFSAVLTNDRRTLETRVKCLRAMAQVALRLSIMAGIVIKVDDGTYPSLSWKFLNTIIQLICLKHLLTQAKHLIYFQPNQQY
jgi:hypothetical protein